MKGPSCLQRSASGLGRPAQAERVSPIEASGHPEWQWLTAYGPCPMSKQEKASVDLIRSLLQRLARPPSLPALPVTSPQSCHQDPSPPYHSPPCHSVLLLPFPLPQDPLPRLLPPSPLQPLRPASAAIMDLSPTCSSQHSQPTHTKPRLSSHTGSRLLRVRVRLSLSCNATERESRKS